MSERRWQIEPGTTPADGKTCGAPGCDGPAIAVLTMSGGGLPSDRTPICPTHLRQFRATVGLDRLATGEPNG